MKNRLFIVALIFLTGAGAVRTQDTTWIPTGVVGALETTINTDTALGGARMNPNRVYALHQGQVYIQDAPIVFKGGSRLTIVGEHGGPLPIVLMKRAGGVNPGDLLYYNGNSIEGSLTLDHIYWMAKTMEGALCSSVFICTTVGDLRQSMVVNDCVLEFAGIDWLWADGWDHGASFRITNSYYRDLFSGLQWWAGRAFTCMHPIDTIWVENSTIAEGGPLLHQLNALCRIGYFNHNTFINANKNWLSGSYCLDLYVTNNLFINQNWVGEDTVNITTCGGDDPDGLFMGTINVDTVSDGVQVPPEFRAPDGSVNQSLVGLHKMKVFVSNNISWTDSLLDSYYTNRNNAWNTVGPYPLSYLVWTGGVAGGHANPPYVVCNVPGIWANRRTLELVAAYPRTMAMTDNIFMRVNTVTPPIANAGIVNLMGGWNQYQWGDPAWPAPPDIVHSAYVFGDQSAATVPGYRNGVKTEDADVGIAKFTDFIENFAQAGTPVLSGIDGLPVGSLIWSDQKISNAEGYDRVQQVYRMVVGVQETPAVAAGYSLDQNYPNPFNPSTTIRYGLPNRARVTLAVFNTLGQQVAILQNGEKDSGHHEVKFDGSNLPSGVYFYRIEAGSFVQTCKLILLR